jgi:hypothetical protein
MQRLPAHLIAKRNAKSETLSRRVGAAANPHTAIQTGLRCILAQTYNPHCLKGQVLPRSQKFSQRLSGRRRFGTVLAYTEMTTLTGNTKEWRLR